MASKSPAGLSANRWVTFLAHFLFILAAWTVFIKYLFPIGYALAIGEPWMRYIYWDFWPVVHVWLGWALLVRPTYLYRLALGIAVLEILIISIKFAHFLVQPEWTIWRTNWFVNKVFVLACFILLLTTVVLRPGLLRPGRHFNPGGNTHEGKHESAH
ncbi:hypothetical protein [Microbulbifer sediminum]|uniref:hypothetical protein n=1 Tax=Microbulbifer sediminum TaxID=2904250 RepID=UPI001F21BB1E|nr:hypothetical protein [Microbulbifer sediminum]